MLSSLNLSRNEVFRLNRTDAPRSAKLSCPTPISVWDFLGRFIDLHGKLKPSVIKKLAKFATDPDTQAALNQLLEKGSRAMTDFNTKKFGLVNLFQHYNIFIKLGQLVEVSTRIPARYYTIASGSKSNPSMIKICVSLTIEDMNTNTFYGRISKNLSDMKARFDKGEACSLRIMPQKSTFYLPTEKQTPCILIASGAGIAPFMSFLEDKAHDLNKNGVSNLGI
jgi:NADPH-ferrihemoprotein reductase